MDKISVFPEKVRSGGNVLSPKDTTDFELVDATLTKSSIVIDDVTRDIFYLQSAVLGTVSLAITDASTGTATNSVVIGTSVVLTATVDDGNPVSGASVIFKVNGVQVGTTQTTDSSGVASYTYTTDTTGNLNIAAECTNYSSGIGYLTVNKHTSAVTMSITDSSIEIGESFELAGTFKIDGTGTSGVHVEVYRDDVLVDTVTTGSGGAWSTSVSATAIGTFKFKAIYAGSSVNEGSETSEYTCTVSKKSSNLNITVPAIVYSDEFDVTGVLKDSSNNAISGASVKLYMSEGSTPSLQSTQTTDSNGAVTYHRTAPTTIETYEFWLEYDGDNTYSAVASSIVEKTVNKETTVLSVSSPSNGANYDSGDSVTVSGTLLTNDSEKLPSGTTVYIKEGTTTLGTASVSTSDGSFSTTLNGLSDGSHTLTIEYAESTYYLGSSVSRTVVLVGEEVVSTVTLATDKSILSYYDSESATLTATPKTSQNVAIPGLPVVFYSGLPEVVNNCTDNSAFSTWAGSPTYSNNGLFLPSTSRVAYTDSIFDLTTSTYKIYLTCTKENTHYLCARVVSSVGSYSNSTIEINDTTIQFLDGNNIYTPSGLGDTIDVLIEWGPSTQKLYIDGDLVATKSISFVNYSDLNYLMFLELNSNEGFTVRNLVIYEDSNDEFIASDITDSNGEATATYQSKGANDITIQASCNNISSSAITIEDDWYVNTGATDKHSNWDTTDSSDTITYDSTNHCYTFAKTTNGDSFIRLTSATMPKTCKLEYDIKLNTGTNPQPRIGLENSSGNWLGCRLVIGDGVPNIGIFGNINSQWIDNYTPTTISSLAQNTWYHMEIIFNGTTMTANIYNGTTLLGTNTQTVSDIFGTDNKIIIDSAYTSNAVCSLKNIKVKSL